MHRESTGVRQVYQKDKHVAITSRNAKTGDVYVALFNLTDDKTPAKVSVKLAELGLKGKCSITNMWTGKKLGKFSNEFSDSLMGHASGLYKLQKK